VETTTLIVKNLLVCLNLVGSDYTSDLIKYRYFITFSMHYFFLQIVFFLFSFPSLGEDLLIDDLFTVVFHGELFLKMSILPSSFLYKYLINKINTREKTAEWDRGPVTKDVEKDKGSQSICRLSLS